MATMHDAGAPMDLQARTAAFLARCQEAGDRAVLAVAPFALALGADAGATMAAGVRRAAEQREAQQQTAEVLADAQARIYAVGQQALAALGADAPADVTLTPPVDVATMARVIEAADQRRRRARLRAEEGLPAD